MIKRLLKAISMNSLGMLALSMYILADTYFIAYAMGAQGLAALNVAIPVYSVIHGFGLMVGIGGGSLFKIALSKKEKHVSHQIFSSTLLIGCLASTVLMIMSFFSSFLTTLFGARHIIHSLSSNYIMILLLFSPLFILNNIFLAFVRNDDRPRLAMLAMIIGSLANIMLDAIFIIVFKWGMMGAALATSIAPLMSLCILSKHVIWGNPSFKWVLTPLKFKTFKSILYAGNASFIIELSTAMGLIVFNLIIFNLNGYEGVAAYGIIANLALITLALFVGIGQGSQPFISHLYGSKQYQHLSSVMKLILMITTMTSFILVIMVNLFSDTLVQFFNHDNNKIVSLLANEGLRLYFVGFLFAGINVVLALMLNAQEKSHQSLTLTVLRGFVILVPLVFMLSSLFEMRGVWFAFICTELIVLICSGIYTYKKENALIN
ncbi:MAG: MATE family efflux transporter [Erysipelotrichaceae bacterium]|nr:MATE family efflux transporter [Erysipelotrichaceae bacterium]